MKVIKTTKVMKDIKGMKGTRDMRDTKVMRGMIAGGAASLGKYPIV